MNSQLLVSSDADGTIYETQTIPSWTILYRGHPCLAGPSYVGSPLAFVLVSGQMIEKPILYKVHLLCRIDLRLITDKNQGYR